MKKSGASPILLWLLVAVIALFAFRSVAQSSTSELRNLLQAESNEQQEDEMASGRIRCCDRCGVCIQNSCECLDPHLTKEIRFVPSFACRPWCYENILVTGGTLGPGDSLKYSATFLEMQRDCNLVLLDNNHGHNVLFSTDTAGKGKNCTLSFTEDGRLAVTDFFSNGNKTIWISPDHSYPKGRYAAILRPNGELAIYGPIVWIQPTIRRPNTREGEHSAAFALQNVGWPLLNNVLFSGQWLRDGEALRISNFRFELNKCNLALIFTIRRITNWESDTYSSDRSCFASLNNHGQLSVVNDLGVTVWSSSPEPLPREGEYALVLEGMGDFGHVVIYGRKSWSTASDQAEERSFEGIRMVTAQ